MALGFSTALANAILDAIANGGTTQSFWDNAILEVRSGTRPSSADTAPTGSVLASMTLPADAMQAASALTIQKNGTWSDASADATGTASWARIKLSGDAGTTNTTDKRLDCNVATSAAELIIDNTSIASGQPVTVTSYQFTLPN